MTSGQDVLERTRRAVIEELMLMGKELLENAERDISVSPSPEIDPDPASALRRSGRVDGPVKRGDRITVGVGFHTRYAAAQHEGAWSYIRGGKRIVAVVRNHPGGGQTHFLSSNLKAMFPTYEERIAKAVRRTMRG